MKKTYKACLLGDAGVGKTALYNLIKHAHGGADAPADTTPTTAVDRHVVVVHPNLHLQFIDVPGAPQYRGMLHALYQTCDIMCFVYDCTNAAETLRNLEHEWLRREIAWFMTPNPAQRYIVIGTKTDVSSISKCPPPELDSLLRACSEQMGGRPCTHLQVNSKFLPLIHQFVQAVEAECDVRRPGVAARQNSIAAPSGSTDEEDLLDALVRHDEERVPMPPRRTCMTRLMSFLTNTIKF